MSTFDAVLVISFGGPQGIEDIRPFLANVLRGRRVAPERVEEVTRHYELFGGVSPITVLTERQAEGLAGRLAASGQPLPVYVGMRNWHPYLADTLIRMYDAGVRRAIGFIAAAFHSYSSCQQYRENVMAARAALREARGGDIAITYVGSWFDHPLFIETNARHVEDALARQSAAGRDTARVIFTAHSVPLPMAEASRYREQLATAARAVADRVGREWALVYQSRSGRPADPWLEPDVCDYLRAEHENGLRAAVLCPIGFVCDHIEVLYDIDREAAAVCTALGIEMTRAAAVNDDPLFIDMMGDVVMRTIGRYTGRPLALVPVPAPAEDAAARRP